MLEFDFTEGVDFYSILSKTSNGGRPSTDHVLKLSMAKEICMLQRNEKGKQARQYFIQCEEAWNNPERIMERAYIIAKKRLEKAELQIEQMKPKAQYFDALVDRNLLTNFRITSKELCVGQKFLINFLLDKKMLYRDSKKNLRPYAGYEEYFHVKDVAGKYSKWAGVQTLVTPKGKEAIRLLLQVEGKIGA